MDDKPPVMTYDFVMGQLKTLAAVGLSFSVGAGYLKPDGASAIMTGLTTFVPLLAPFAWSAFTNAGTKKVPANSVAIIPHDANPAAMGSNIAGKVVG